MRVLGAILGGGQSSRFGSDKAVALLHGLPLMDHASAGLRPHVEAVITVGRDWHGLVRVEDEPEPGLGPLGGLLGETGGVPAPVRLHDLDVVVTGQFLVHHDGVPGGHRGGERVDDEQQTQGSPR